MRAAALGAAWHGWPWAKAARVAAIASSPGNGALDLLCIAPRPPMRRSSAASPKPPLGLDGLPELDADHELGEGFITKQKIEGRFERNVLNGACGLLCIWRRRDIGLGAADPLYIYVYAVPFSMRRFPRIKR